MPRERIRLCVLMGGHYSAVVGGAQYQAHRLVEHLKETGTYDIFYIARRIDSAYAPNGYRVVHIGPPGRWRRLTFLMDSRKVVRVLKDIRPHLIYQRGVKGHTAIAARYAASCDAKLVVHLAHDYDVVPDRNVNRGLSSWIDKKAGIWGLRKSDAVIAQTTRQAELMRRHLGMNPSRVIPNFHPRPREPIVKDNSPVRVVWVANLKETKRPDAFLRLARSFSDNASVEFVMIGRGDGGRHEHAAESASRELPNFSYLGERPMEFVNQMLARSHVFVNTSEAEGFPNTFIQAWMRAVPVLSLDADVEDSLSSRKCGALCATEEQLRLELQNLVNDEHHRAALGETARQFAVESFSDHRAHEIDNLFLRLVQSN